MGALYTYSTGNLGGAAGRARRTRCGSPQLVQGRAEMKGSLSIALIASSRFPISQPFAGGLEAHVWHLARALAHHGHQVSLFAASGSDRDLDCDTMAVHHLDISEAARADVSMPSESFMADHHAYLTLMMELAGCARDDFDLI